MNRVKFDATYSDEINMYSEIYGTPHAVSLDRLWNAFSDAGFDAGSFDEVTLVKLLWTKTP